MKKILSLILATFISLSLVTISVGADDGIELKGMPLNRLTLDVDINDIIGGKNIIMDYSLEVNNPATLSIGGLSYIKYTLDGSDPKNGEYYFYDSGSVSPLYQESYTNELNLTEAGTYTLRAIASTGGLTSDEYSKIITVNQVSKPTISNSGNTVTIKSSTSDTSIYYTLDGSTPTTDSNLYTSEIILSEAATVKAIAVKSGYANSQVAASNITYSDPTTSPTDTPIPETDENDYDETKSDQDNQPDYEDEDYYDGDGEDDAADEEYSDAADYENEDFGDEDYENEDYEDEYVDDNYDDNLISSEWAEAEIKEAFDCGLIPEIMVNEDLTKVITREKFTAIAVNLYQSLSGDYIDYDNADILRTPFIDCYYRESDYLNYISIAYDLGLIAGVSKTEFAPESAISRQDLCVMLGRVVKKCMYEGWSIENDSRYSFDTSGARLFDDDSDISDYAKESVYFMAKNRIVLGVDDTHFAPQNITDWQKANGYATSTKEQAIAISLRCCNKFLNLSD